MDDNEIVVREPSPGPVRPVYREEPKPSSRPKGSFDFTGCAVWAVENGTFALGMGLMFSKTVDLMTAFAPGTIFGFSGLEVFYGLAVGVLIEGAMFVMKLTLPKAKNVIDWMWNVIVVVAPFIISALAQVFDSLQVRATLSTQPPYIQTFVTWFVPSIPTVIIFLLIGKSIFASVPEGILPLPDFSSEPAAPGVAKLPAVPPVQPGIRRIRGFVGRFVPRKTPAMSPASPASDGSVHAPSLCPVCHSPLPFLEYGHKIGKNGLPAKWPIYEKCKNPACSIGRKNLGLPKAVPGEGGNA